MDQFSSTTAQLVNLSLSIPPQERLRHALSPLVPSSTTSTAPPEEEDFDPRAAGSDIVISVGKGTCGEIFTHVSSATGDHDGNMTRIVLKRAFPGWETDLFIDYTTHKRLHEVYLKHAAQLSLIIPECHAHNLPSEDDFWSNQHTPPVVTPPSGTTSTTPATRPWIFPPHHPTSSRPPVLLSQGIPFLHSPVRSAILSTFCPPHALALANSNPANRDCLIRLYLGSRHAPRWNSLSSLDNEGDGFSVRNFALTFDRMEGLGFTKAEIGVWARCIGQGLALLHWGADVDGRDVEFVLGGTNPSTALSQQPQAPDMAAVQNAKVRVWLLDFNQCRAITRDRAGCILAARAHWDNDPYYPRPDREEDRHAWKAFVDGYTATAELILDEEEGAADGGEGSETSKEKGRELAEMYLQEVVKECRRRYPGGPPGSAPPMAGERSTVTVAGGDGQPRAGAERSQGRRKPRGGRDGRIVLEDLDQVRSMAKPVLLVRGRGFPPVGFSDLDGSRTTSHCTAEHASGVNVQVVPLRNYTANMCLDPRV